jgi:hypothetical protein
MNPVVPFHSVLETAPLGVQVAVRNGLRRLEETDSACRAMVHNLFEDATLAAQDWQALIDELAASVRSRRDFQTAVRTFCASLRPGSARPFGPLARPGTRFLGRLVTLSTFIAYLRSAGIFHGKDEAYIQIRAIIGQDPSMLPARVRRWPLGRFAIWSTFKPDRDESPFDPPLVAHRLLERLGLAPLRPGDSILLLEYDLPMTIEARVPTFVDAYIGSSWNQWFRAPSRGCRYGKTRPAGPFEGRDRPEVIHGVILAGALRSPIREI